MQKPITIPTLNLSCGVNRISHRLLVSSVVKLCVQSCSIANRQQGLPEAPPVTQQELRPKLARLRKRRVMFTPKHISRERSQQFVLRSKVPVERGLFHIQVSSKCSRSEAIDTGVVAHMCRATEDGRTVESRLFLSHTCT